MSEDRGRAPLTAIAGLLLLVVPSTGCGPHAAEDATVKAGQTIRIASTVRGVQSNTGETLKEVLRRTNPEMRVEVLTTNGSVENTLALQRDEAELVMTVADVAYLGYIGQLPQTKQRLDKLRGVATLAPLPLQVVVRRGLVVHSIGELKGRHIGIGPMGSACPLTAELVLQAFHLSLNDVDAETIPADEASQHVAEGRLDGAFGCESAPYAAKRAALGGGAMPVPIAGAAVDRLRADYPFLKVVVMREYQGVAPFSTVYVDALAATRSTLGEEEVYRLTKALHVAMPQLDPSRAPATSVPLHPGAARYYREQEIAR
jgi:TRAP transporter TAXI family solute receptor